MSLDEIVEAYKKWYFKRRGQEATEQTIINFMNYWYGDIKNYMGNGMSAEEAMEELDKFYNN